MPHGLIIVRTTILYFVLLLVMRIMGKRELGQLSPFDFVVSILLAELAAIPMQDAKIPLYHGIVPIITLVTLQIALSFMTMHSETIRKLVNGSPAILIKNGQIQHEELRRNRCNVNDLMIHLRQKDIFDAADVEYAILEPSGKLSVVPKSQKRPVTPEDLQLSTPYEGLPIPLVIDGHIHKQSLNSINLDEKWLYTELEKQGVTSVKNVLFASLNTKGELFVAKKD